MAPPPGRPRKLRSPGPARVKRAESISSKAEVRQQSYRAVAIVQLAHPGSGSVDGFRSALFCEAAAADQDIRPSGNQGDRSVSRHRCPGQQQTASLIDVTAP